MIDKDGNIRVRVNAEASVKNYINNDNQYLDYSYGETIDPEQSVATLISKLQRIQNEAKGKYTDLVINSSRDCGCRWECECDPTYHVMGKRPATQMEIDFYAERERKQEEQRVARDLAEHARLTKEYGAMAPFIKR